MTGAVPCLLPAGLPISSLAPWLLVVALAAEAGVVLVARPRAVVPHLVDLVVREAGRVVVQRVRVDAPAAATAASHAGRQGGGALLDGNSIEKMGCFGFGFKTDGMIFLCKQHVVDVSLGVEHLEQ